MIRDPRPPVDASAASASARRLFDLAERSLSAPTGELAATCDADIVDGLREHLAGRGETTLAALFEDAPSVAVHRHLWRLLVTRALVGDSVDAGLAVRWFAIPIVLVAGVAGAEVACVRVPAVLKSASAIRELLREHGALGGNETFALANALVAADAIDLAELPRLVQAATRLSDGNALAAPDLAPAAIEVRGEAAHLRFIVGTAIAAPGAGLFDAQHTGSWGAAIARTLMADLATPGVSVLALPRPALSLPAAVAHGRAAQREVAAQLFASNALRQLRASVGEPAAVISAHAASDAPGGGELRLSLSSPLSPRDAQGFRCPLFAGERVHDVATMLVDLLRDCRVTDVRVISGVHPDRDPITGGPLMFKPETLPPDADVVLH